MFRPVFQEIENCDYLFNVVTLSRRSNYHLHLENIPLTHTWAYNIFKYRFLVKPSKENGHIKFSVEIWGEYRLFLISCIYRNDPVRSDTPGHRNVCARTLAPLLVNLRIRFHPCTPPPLTYRVPVTMLAPVSICFL